MDVGIRYVAKHGNDSWDGLDWGTPKLTVAAAVKSLPLSYPGTGVARHTGKVMIGTGLFVETDLPIECNTGLTFEGMGTGPGEGEGTTIKQGAADHLFARTPDFTDWEHHLLWNNLQLKGDPDNFPGDYDLVRLEKAGFNTEFRRVFFHNASRYGLRVVNTATNCYLYNCSGADCREALFRFEIEASSNLFNFGSWGLQFDNCGRYPIQIVSHADGGANKLFFDGVECEAEKWRPWHGDDLHEAVIHYERPDGANPLAITLKNFAAFRSGGIAGPDQVILEAAPARGIWILENIIGSGYDQLLKSDVDPARSITDKFVWGQTVVG